MSIENGSKVFNLTAGRPDANKPRSSTQFGSRVVLDYKRSAQKRDEERVKRAIMIRAAKLDW